jgi:hypothetical protein
VEDRNQVEILGTIHISKGAERTYDAAPLDADQSFTSMSTPLGKSSFIRASMVFAVGL